MTNLQSPLPCATEEVWLLNSSTLFESFKRYSRNVYLDFKKISNRMRDRCATIRIFLTFVLIIVETDFLPDYFKLN